MKQIPSAEFRKLYTSANEPIEVTSHGKVIGTWLPIGADIPVPASDFGEGLPVTEAEPTRFTIRPQLRPRPEMEATSKPISDPLDLRKHEQARSEELFSRTYGRRKA